MCLRCRGCRDKYPGVCEVHAKVLSVCCVCMPTKSRNAISTKKRKKPRRKKGQRDSTVL